MKSGPQGELAGCVVSPTVQKLPPGVAIARRAVHRGAEFPDQRCVVDDLVNETLPLTCEHRSIGATRIEPEAL